MIRVDNIVLPNESLSNLQLIEAVEKLKIPNFRGVFMRDSLPSKPKAKECGILNLDDSNGGGTHWTAWYKDNKKLYFDSYGLVPPTEMVKYLKPGILYNTERVQAAGQVFCGHLCLYVLKELSEGKHFQDIVSSLH